jgi:hypothetical protein
MERTPQTLIITLENVSPADAVALKKMFEYMQYLGKIGSSRMCSYFADGDGSFRPSVCFTYPVELPEVPNITGIKPDGDFQIDSDAIAWEIYDH